MPVRWLPGPHAQTIVGRLLRGAAPTPSVRRERVETPDGDFLDLDLFGGRWPEAGDPPSDADLPVAILLHGLEGSARSGYIRETARRLSERGVGSIGLNFRSRSGEPNRTRRFYHSGETGDLAFVVEWTASRRPRAPIGLVGFSLGGNVLLKYLGERGDGVDSRLTAAVAASVPFDLTASARVFDSGAGRIYGSFFLRSLKATLRRKAELFPDAYDLRRAEAARTLREFDEAVTAPVHGFRDAADYYRRSSSARFLGDIRLPTLLIQAWDDPFVPRASVPAAAIRENPALRTRFSERGGHLGFVGRRSAWVPALWAERTAADFLAAALARAHPGPGRVFE